MRALAAVAVCLLFPTAAAAHSQVAGSDGFIVGLLHPLEDVLQAMATVALGFFVGQQPAVVANRTAGAFIAGLVIGLAAAFLPTPPFIPIHVILATSIVAGVVVAARPRLPSAASLSLGAAGGLVVGLDLVPGLAPLETIAFIVAGSFVSVAILFAYAVICAKWIAANTKWPWLGICLRIAGSWITAASVLLIALASRV